MNTNKDTVKITSTALLAALVVMLDYVGLKIPFPWMPILKFDVTGVPIAIATLLFGITSGGLTSIIAFLSIIIRSGNYIGGLMKAIAEFSTVTGFGVTKYIPERYKQIGAPILAILLRVIFMTITNSWVMPNVYMIPWDVTMSMLPMIAAFNIIQGIITLVLGIIIYKRLKAILN